MADAQPTEIRNQLNGIAKGEMRVELEAVCGVRNG